MTSDKRISQHQDLQNAREMGSDHRKVSGRSCHVACNAVLSQACTHGLFALVTNFRVRLMKLPRLFFSSALFLAARSDHLKSASELSGRLANR